jgi:signal transduction histidine kinase/CheY-like chemotaxis protein
MQADKNFQNHDLFYAELIDLKQEIMTWGLIVPLMVIGYVGLLISYQKPFLDHFDARTPLLFAGTCAFGLICALVSRKHTWFATRLTAWGTLLIAFAFLCTGTDGYTAIGITVACSAIALLLSPLTSWLAIAVSALGLALFAIANPSLELWPGKISAVIIASIFLTVLVQSFTRVLFRALRWTQSNYEVARVQTKALVEKSGQLSSALKSLEQTSFQLARANEQMELAMRYAEEARLSKQEFAASVSHELRAPLNLIIGFSELILNEPGNYQTEFSPKLLADIHVINNHAQHLLKLVNDILDLSQLDVNYLSIMREPIQLEEVVRAAARDYQYLVTQHGLNLAVDIDPGLPMVMADATRIRQVLTNLLSNALRVTDQGEIAIRARLCREPHPAQPAVTQANPNIVISVSDTGCGIQPTDLQRIFEPFVQLSHPTSSGHVGSGLGLTISKRFVELHGGHMWVESTYGRGSTFYFSLPIESDQPALQLHRLPHEMKRHEVGTLAIVERTGVLSRLVERRIAGMKVESVESIAALCNKDKCNAEVILINEPIRSEPESSVLPEQLNRIPVFRCYVHGALSLPEMNGQTLNHSYDYLIKPVKREQLYNTLARLLSIHTDDHRRPARILIIEDDEDASYLLSRMLRLAPPTVYSAYQGITILKARSGEQAIQMLSELAQPDAEPIDAILLDLVLGAVSGYTVLSELESRAWLRDIPVCVITGQVASGDLLVTPYLTFTRQNGLSARELAEAVTALTKIALPGVDVSIR